MSVLSLALLLGLLAGLGCSGSESAPTAQGYVVTIPPLAMVMREVAPPGVAIDTLLRPGESPHTYELSPGDALRAGQANALIYIARDLDGWAAKVDAPAKVALFDLLPPEQKLEMPEAHAAHDGHDHGEYDAHFWLDPLAVKAVLAPLCVALEASGGVDAAALEARAGAFAARLDALHAELSSTLEPLRGRKVLLHHPSFRYFLKRYGMEAAGYIESSPGKEPSPREVAELIALIGRAAVFAVCSEPQLSPRAARTVAESAGIPLIQLDPLGGASGTSTYEDLLRYNATQLLGALQ